MANPIAARRTTQFRGITRFMLVALALLAATPAVRPAAAAQADLTWTAPTTPVAGYKVHIGSSARNYQQHIDVGNRTSYSTSSLLDGSTYYFTVSAYNGSGAESSYSNEVSRSFAALPATYTISATAGSGGRIMALNNTNVSTATSGSTTIASVTVNDGASQSFSIAPSTGYRIADVRVDGASLGAVASYTFTSVKANHSISATFTATTTSHTITASAGTGGTISPAGAVSVSHGASRTFAITPASGYRIASLNVDGAAVSTVSSYTFTNVTANHTIAATFAATAGRVVFATNCGGAQFTDSLGVVYRADSYYSGGTAGYTAVAISGTTDDALFTRRRIGSFSYNIPIANGNYSVTLRFAETYYSAAGQRVFDVRMEGAEVLSNLDVFARVGKNAAYNVTIPVSVTDGQLNIGIVGNTGSAMLQAIRVQTR